MGGMFAVVARPEPAHLVRPIGSRSNTSGAQTQRWRLNCLRWLPDFRKLATKIAVRVLQLPTPMVRTHLL